VASSWLGQRPDPKIFKAVDEWWSVNMPPYKGLEFLLILVSIKIALLTELDGVKVMDG